MKGHKNAIFDSSINIKRELTRLFDLKFAENMPFPVSVKIDLPTFSWIFDHSKIKVFLTVPMPALTLFLPRKAKKLGLLKFFLAQKQEEQTETAAAKRKTHLKLQFLMQQLLYPDLLCTSSASQSSHLGGHLFYIRAYLLKKLHYTHNNKES